MTESPLPLRGRYYRPELDVVRFFAFLFVFLYHSMPDGNDERVMFCSRPVLAVIDAIVKSCGFGLQLFFALSAFLICELLMREREATGTVSVKQFYIRRILRIWPLYYFGVALGFLYQFLSNGTQAQIVPLLSLLVFMGGWQIALGHFPNNPAGVLWSVSVEEQFYLFVPWMVKYLRKKTIIVTCILLIVNANLWLAFLGIKSASDNRIWFDSFVQFQSFAAGILLSVVLRGRTPQASLWSRAALIICGFGGWLVATYLLHIRFAGMEHGKDPGAVALIVGYLLVSIGCVLILIAFLGIDSAWLPRWAIYLGRISFGLYVYHHFALNLTEHLTIGHKLTLQIPSHIVRVTLSGVIDLGITLLLISLFASLSYRYLEMPFLRMKKRHAIIDSQPILEDR